MIETKAERDDFDYANVDNTAALIGNDSKVAVN